ncbi:hypothetical protein BZG36_04486 [Bifiguratus adelaidae]|uniref:60S ribosomal protein L36 n=1 Tax=Bifiguratus adelaidae TaxID=1938954 RepID=A0A261XYG5_9FUNG|nr:hypothetical protein BZG36_04486 [Bifiguratus adelaidae]
MAVTQRTGLAVGINKGHITTRRELKVKPSYKKGKLGNRTKFVRDLVREVCGFAPYERRVMELLKNSKDKRARKLAKKRLGTFVRAKKKVEELSNSSEHCDPPYDGDVSRGGVIRFKCGSRPVTIKLDKALSVTKQTTVIDGEGLITLDGQGKTRIITFNNGNYNDTNPKLTVQRLRFVNGNSKQTGSQAQTMYGGGGAIFRFGGSLDVVDCDFAHNHGPSPGQDVAGGAIYSIGSGLTRITGSIFYDNSASNGGAIGNLGNDFAIYNSYVGYNRATGTGGNPGNGGNGGGISMDGKGRSSTMCGVAIVNNSANKFGGGYFRVSYANEMNRFDHLVVDSNVAQKSGGGLAGGLYIQGGIFIVGSAKGIKLDNLIISENEAFTGLGGGITCSGSVQGTFERLTISRNRTPGSAAFGAGITGCNNIKLADSAVVDNSAGNAWNPLNCFTTGLTNGGNDVQSPQIRSTKQADPGCVPNIKFISSGRSSRLSRDFCVTLKGVKAGAEIDEHAQRVGLQPTYYLSWPNLPALLSIIPKQSVFYNTRLQCPAEIPSAAEMVILDHFRQLRRVCRLWFMLCDAVVNQTCLIYSRQIPYIQRQGPTLTKTIVTSRWLSWSVTQLLADPLTYESIPELTKVRKLILISADEEEAAPMGPWQEPTFEFRSDVHLDSMLRHCRYITQLHTVATHIRPLMKNLASSMPMLENLALSECLVKDVDDLSRVIHNFLLLRKLSVGTKTTWTSGIYGEKVVQNLIENLGLIDELCLVGLPVNEESMTSIGSCQPHLKRLTLDNTQHNYSSLCRLTPRVARYFVLSQLRHITISETYALGTSIHEFFKSLHYIRTVTYLLNANTLPLPPPSADPPPDRALFVNARSKLECILYSCPNLETFEFSAKALLFEDNWVFDDTIVMDEGFIKGFVDILSGCETIKKLRLLFDHYPRLSVAWVQKRQADKIVNEQSGVHALARVFGLPEYTDPKPFWERDGGFTEVFERARRTNNSPNVNNAIGIHPQESGFVEISERDFLRRKISYPLPKSPLSSREWRHEDSHGGVEVLDWNNDPFANSILVQDDVPLNMSLFDLNRRYSASKYILPDIPSIASFDDFSLPDSFDLEDKLPIDFTFATVDAEGPPHIFTDFPPSLFEELEADDDIRYIVWEPDVNALTTREKPGSLTLGFRPAHLRNTIKRSFSQNFLSSRRSSHVQTTTTRQVPNDPPPKQISAASVEKLVGKLTSTLDYNFLTDFFLTYRTFIEPLELCQLLILRFRWAFANNEEKRRLVRIRTFVVIRHWLQNYFVHDFVSNRPLRHTLVAYLNELRHDKMVRESSRDRRIVKSLRDLFFRLKQLNYGSNGLDNQSSDAFFTTMGDWQSQQRQGNIQLRNLSSMVSFVSLKSLDSSLTSGTTTYESESSVESEDELATFLLMEAVEADSLPINSLTEDNTPDAQDVSTPVRRVTRFVDVPKATSKILERLSSESGSSESPLEDHPPALASVDDSKAPNEVGANEPSGSHERPSDNMVETVNDVVSEKPATSVKSASVRSSSLVHLHVHHRVETRSAKEVNSQKKTSNGNAKDEQPLERPTSASNDIGSDETSASSHSIFSGHEDSSARSPTTMMSPTNSVGFRHSTISEVSPSLSTVLLHGANAPLEKMTLRLANMTFRRNLPNNQYRQYFHVPWILYARSEIVTQQMCLIERDALLDVGWEELIQVKWKTKKDTADSLSTRSSAMDGGVDALIQRFNLVVQWVSTEILCTYDVDQRARVIEKFIRIAQKCRKYSNFATLVQLLLGLQSPAVSRLKKTWACVNSRELRLLDELSEFTSPMKNWKHIRDTMTYVAEELGSSSVDVSSYDTSTGFAAFRGLSQKLTKTAVKDIQGACIPFLGIYLSDLVFNSELPSYLRAKYASDMPTMDPLKLQCLVNFRKHRITAGVIKRVLTFQNLCRKYPFEERPTLFEECLKLSTYDASTLLMLSHRLVTENSEAIKTAIWNDLKRADFESAAIVHEIAYNFEHLEEWSKDVAVDGSAFKAQGILRRDPLGVVLNISPWNFPILLTLLPLIGAIAAGNCVLLKPSEISCHSEALLVELIPKYMDLNTIRIVTGGPTEMIKILEHRFDLIVFTGSAKVGREVAQRAAKHVTPCILELGGKCPAIVLDDGTSMQEIGRRLAFAKLTNAGQVCVAPDYVVCDPAMVDPLMESFSQAARDILYVAGDDPKTSPYFGSIINERHLDRLERLSTEALESGKGTFLFDLLPDRETLFMPPMIIKDTSLNDPIMQDEIFGPILPILTHRPENNGTNGYDTGLDGILSLASLALEKHPHPLVAYLFGSHAHDRPVNAFVDSVQCGSVCINDMMRNLPGMPFGGYGASGYGHYGGQWGFNSFCHIQRCASSPQSGGDRYGNGDRYGGSGRGGTPPSRYGAARDYEAKEGGSSYRDEGANRRELFGDTSRYGDPSRDRYGRPVDRRQEYAEQYDDDPVGDIKQQINFVKQDTLASTRNALFKLHESEGAAGNTMDMLGNQSVQLANVDRHMDSAKVGSDRAADSTTELKKLNRSIFIPVISNPFTKKSRERKEIENLNRYAEEQERSAMENRKYQYESKKRVENAQKTAQSGYQSGTRGRSQADRNRYQFEADAEDDAVEDEIDQNLDAMSSAIGNLKNMALNMGTEVQSQNKMIDRIDRKIDPVNERLRVTSHKLGKIK